MESFNLFAYKKWKRANVTYRGMKNTGEPNNVYGSLGNGLYTTPSSNKSWSRTYGTLYFVVNGKPKKPKVFKTLNDWEIWFQCNLIFPYSKKEGKEKKKWKVKAKGHEQLIIVKLFYVLCICV